MQAQPVRDDTALLSLWTVERSEQAFAEIVHNYERLVFGAALRRTGDAELARDVAQQVFATLAVKARLLVGRTNIAGWLYRAASHIAARSVQSERRRRALQEQLETSACTESNDAHWPLVEEALAGLSPTDRESLVLHYFQDLGYAEIGIALRIRETAARKRVSRALRNLEVKMRRQGIRGSAAALLVAAAAQQGSLPTQAGLASAALAASASSVSAPWLTFTTIMSQPSIKIAACVSALAVAPLAVQHHSNGELRKELERQHLRQPVSGPMGDRFSQPQSEAALRADLAKIHAERMNIENRLAEVGALKETIDQQVVISLGTIESMAGKVAHLLSLANKLEAKPQEALHPELLKERATAAREMAEAMPEVMNIVREIPKMERDPRKAAHFYTTVLADTIYLDPDTRAGMEADVAEWIRGLQQDGLALVQRPPGKAEQWDARRDHATREILARVKSRLPPAQLSNPAIEQFFQPNFAGSGEFYETLTAESRP